MFLKGQEWDYKMSLLSLMRRGQANLTKAWEKYQAWEILCLVEFFSRLDDEYKKRFYCSHILLRLVLLVLLHWKFASNMVKNFNEILPINPSFWWIWDLFIWKFPSIMVKHLITFYQKSLMLFSVLQNLKNLLQTWWKII